MKKLTNCIILVALLANSACAGHNANPVMVAQYGDDRMSCKELEISMSEAQNEMARLVGQTDKTGQNVALGVAGLFLLVPWFFMDFKDGEKEEYDAWRQRYNHLGMLAEEKHCGEKRVHYPTGDEIERAAKKKQEESKVDSESDQ